MYLPLMVDIGYGQEDLSY